MDERLTVLYMESVQLPPTLSVRKKKKDLSYPITVFFLVSVTVLLLKIGAEWLVEALTMGG